MGIFEILGIALVLLLIILIIRLRLQTREGMYEMVEVDPEDPEMKAIIEKRNDFINTLMSHLAVNLNADPEELDNSCKMVHISPTTSILTVAQVDALYRFTIVWDKRVKVNLFRNDQDVGIVTNMTKRFRIKDNLINEAKYTAFLQKFRTNAFDYVESMDAKEFKALGIAAAKEIIATQDDATLEVLLYNFLMKFDRDAYNDDETAIIDYASILAYVLKFHAKEFNEFLKSQHK